jgi:CheY-like chemotaxis protein
MVVDDDSSIRALIGAVLKDGGYSVQEAVHGGDALNRLRASRPDVIVLDLMMPVIDGPTFLKVCRALPHCAAIPVVAVSADPALLYQAESLGASACLSKPFELEDVCHLVKRFAPPKQRLN